jgi:hypothetical protein
MPASHLIRPVQRPTGEQKNPYQCISARPVSGLQEPEASGARDGVRLMPKAEVAGTCLTLRPRRKTQHSSQPERATKGPACRLMVDSKPLRSKGCNWNR